MKKHIIWSNIDIDSDNWENDYREFCEDNDIEYDENNLYEWINETLMDYYDNEFNYSLDYKLDNQILVVATLGLWNGIHHGFKLLGNNLSDTGTIIGQDEDYAEWYVEDEEFKATGIHHDGTNHYLFRVLKDGVYKDDIDDLLSAIYDNKSYDDLLDKYTNPLGDTVANIYGWKNN